MKSRRRMRDSVAGGVLCFAVCGLIVIRPPQAQSQSLSPEARAAWRKAGAEIYGGKKANFADITSYQGIKVLGQAQLTLVLGELGKDQFLGSRPILRASAVTTGATARMN